VCGVVVGYNEGAHIVNEFRHKDQGTLLRLKMLLDEVTYAIEKETEYRPFVDSLELFSS
jgi:hypothetical protein